MKSKLLQNIQKHYAEQLLNSSNSKGLDASSWFTVVNEKPRLLDSAQSSSAGSNIDPNRRKIIGCSSSGSSKIKSSRDAPASWHFSIGKLDPVQGYFQEFEDGV